MFDISINSEYFNLEEDAYNNNKLILITKQDITINANKVVEFDSGFSFGELKDFDEYYLIDKITFMDNVFLCSMRIDKEKSKNNIKFELGNYNNRTVTIPANSIIGYIFKSFKFNSSNQYNEMYATYVYNDEKIFIKSYDGSITQSIVVTEPSGEKYVKVYIEGEPKEPDEIVPEDNSDELDDGLQISEEIEELDDIPENEPEEIEHNEEELN